MSDMSDQPLFHLSPRELFDLFEAGWDKGSREEVLAGRHWRTAVRKALKDELVGIMFTHALHIRHEAGDTACDRDELRRAIEAMFKGVGPK